MNNTLASEETFAGNANCLVYYLRTLLKGKEFHSVPSVFNVLESSCKCPHIPEVQQLSHRNYETFCLKYPDTLYKHSRIN